MNFTCCIQQQCNAMLFNPWNQQCSWLNTRMDNSFVVLPTHKPQPQAIPPGGASGKAMEEFWQRLKFHKHI
ncbi:hypothetical protein DY000_02056838 [Brassica cretica]|uniref:Apple domain-containing protein n=1 Tax=Brassica cretica TaxID=69181 RepID=A0ABQ7ABA5_BRACR|nr:hypothetical protein DY000_02056838 [Brassica cretica]